ncbi:conserved Plasmodium protein, unknown function [Plasmodium gallinaceum]|uniref:Cilia- and flagella-associated protein 251 n=1 Tax=Plasmodium gallinaceum TaxID=5849 RepID=A0A1J1GVM9_PLAGA|nr:conserved Plasmodium protein, unknown function [Plasmodium gallinaceum]CRG96600.1 conserved Plasmodium protein, unknown function [Plasmodium gallinaceum]
MKIENNLDEPINLKFCYGINESLGSVHIIKKKEKEKEKINIIYSSDNNIVMLDGKKQILFRGHFNQISQIIRNYNNEFLISCDKGTNSFILLWRISNNELTPIKKFCFSSSSYDKNKNDINKDLNEDNKKEVYKENINENENNNIGYECVDISFDNRYICALTEEKTYFKSNDKLLEGKSGKNNLINNVHFQELIIFDVSGGENNVVCTDKIYGKEKQTKIRFNKNYEIISNSSSKLYIYNFDKKNRTISHYSPSLYKSSKVCEQFIFTETSFIENSTALLTGTTNGFLIVWDYSTIFINKTKNNIKQREYQKSLEIRKNISINIVLSYGNFVIIGLSDGSVQIFDKELKCYAWFENDKIGAIRSLSFEFCNFEKDFFLWNSFILFTDKNIIKQINPHSFRNKFLNDKEKYISDNNLDIKNDKSYKMKLNNKINGNNKKNHNGNSYSDDKISNEFHDNDRILKKDNIDINKKDAIVNIESECLDDIYNNYNVDNYEENTTKNNKNETILHFYSSCINCICINPVNNENIIYIGNKDGLIEIFDFDKNENISMIDLKGKEIITMIFSNNGQIICVGCKCGSIHLINSNSYEIFFNSKDMKYEIKYLYFSEDDKILVCSSNNGNIIIYKNDNENIYDWKYAYKIVNNNNITLNDLNIVKEVDKYYTYIIIAITDNRYIIFHYYDFRHNSVVISYLLIEQIHTPTCLTSNLYFYNRQILCICNDASKIRFFDLENKKIIKTVHLPFKEKKVQAFIPLINCNNYQENLKNDDNMYKNILNKKIKNNFDKKNIFLFVLNEKMIVFTQSPIDANCFRYIGGIVCSGSVKNVVVKNNKIFIQSNNKIFYYNINIEVLKKNIEIQNYTLETFIDQIGGRKGKTYNQIIDSFYYCEIQKKKYEGKKEKHEIKKLLNILSIEYIFASINVFLSKFEIQNIIQEYHFYYKYVLQLLKEQNDITNEIVFMEDIKLVNYKSEEDILLQNIFFIQLNEKKDKKENYNKNFHKEILNEFNKEVEMNYMDNVLKEKKIEKNEMNKNDLNNNKNIKLENEFEEKEIDFTKECENIYFNINAFIYTYFNFVMEEEINFEKLLVEIINYYKKKKNQKNITFSDFFYILKKYGEIMDRNEFKRIFQVFTKKEEFFNDDDTLDFDTLKYLFQ